MVNCGVFSQKNPLPTKNKTNKHSIHIFHEKWGEMENHGKNKQQQKNPKGGKMQICEYASANLPKLQGSAITETPRFANDI